MGTKAKKGACLKHLVLQVVLGLREAPKLIWAANLRVLEISCDWGTTSLRGAGHRIWHSTLDRIKFRVEWELVGTHLAESSNSC